MSEGEQSVGGAPQSTGGVVHLHFVGDVTDHGDGFECQRCGFPTESKQTIADHRRGFVSECDRMRLKDWVSQYV